MDRQFLDLYSDYLISSFGKVTATGLSELSRCTELFTHLLNADQSFSLFICVINFVQLLNCGNSCNIYKCLRDFGDDAGLCNLSCNRYLPFIKLALNIDTLSIVTYRSLIFLMQMRFINFHFLVLLLRVNINKGHYSFNLFVMHIRRWKSIAS